MKYIILLTFLCAVEYVCAQQIRFLGCEVKEHNNAGATFYAIRKDAPGLLPFGQVEFTPDGTKHWEYKWTYEGAGRPVIYSGDSTSLMVDLLGNGNYMLEAKKEGSAAVTVKFTVFYVHLSFNIQLADVEDCEYITIKINDLVKPEYNGFGGSGNVYYTVGWDGRDRELQPVSDYLYPSISQSLTGVDGKNRADHDVDCFVKIKDKFGFEWKSNEETYISLIPTADWEIELLNNVDAVGQVNEDMGQAPLEVVFHNNSINSQQWEWFLYRDTTDLRPLGPATLEDSLLDNRIRYEEEPRYTYLHPGRYRVQMKAINTNGVNRCWDTIPAQYVNVVLSLVNVPNVFTPNGDGKNDFFKVQTFSVESFKGVIINRWGRVVYEWTDPAGGWDGRINGKYATPGTYYYIITARGREKIAPPRYVKKGPLLLVR